MVGVGEEGGEKNGAGEHWSNGKQLRTLLARCGWGWLADV